VKGESVLGFGERLILDDRRRGAEEVYRHVYRVYSTFPSPYYANAVA